MKLPNHTALIKAGQATRFGRSWPGRRCGAKTRAGGACKNPAINNRSRCALHGGKSSGPKTPEGGARVAAVHWKHGRRSMARTAKVRQINAELRRIILEGRRARLIITLRLNHCRLNRNQSRRKVI
jgi:hypothetical protein